MTEPQLWQLSDIARHLGVSRQRAWIIVRNRNLKFPAPAHHLSHGNVWDREQVVRWTRVWQAGKAAARD